MRSSILGTAAFVACAATIGACVDLAPVAYEPPVESDASTLDAPADAVDLDALVPQCGMCLSTGACASAYAKCAADSKCANFAACMTPSACWGSSLTDLTHLSPCLLKCSIGAGITGTADPSALVVQNILLCAQDPAAGCGVPCAGASTEQ